jgi:hypothetical protein
MYLFQHHAINIDLFCLIIGSFKLSISYLRNINNFITTYSYNMAIVGIYHLLVLYLKHDVSVTGFCLRLQVEPTQMGLIDRASQCTDTVQSSKCRLLNERQDNG